MSINNNTVVESVPLRANNAFSNLLAEFRDGRSLSELSENLQLLVAAVEETGKPAELTYKLKFSPAATGAIVVVDDLKIKMPQEDRERAIFFPTEAHTLQRQNPKQRELTLREVDKPAPVEVREVQPISAAVQN